MAGLIRSSDIEEVKSRTNIADIVGDYVTLKSAGVGSMKGLCPFHDERSPSFHVRPQLGFYHCFGCGESGDAISFLQKMDHVTFTEAVERLAQRAGITLTYEDGGKGRSDHGQRARLLAANSAAGDFFRAQLLTDGAAPGQQFLGSRGFDMAAAEHFGIGYAPKSWDALTSHLTGLGFTTAELTTAGLVSSGDRGVYDRFRGRLVWPIRDVTGATIGFGARRLLDDDKGPKYLNTPETPVYHKNQVLYGLDLAKREIARGGQVVVVEGYTDVMAAHLAGVTTAVATCGTAFGVEHIKVIRRIMGDSTGTGEVIFTFDPDAAGQKAAMRAFAEEKRFSAQTYVAVAPDGLDPCDLRLERGDEAVRRLIDQKEPMFEFVIKQLLSGFDLETVEGRVGGLRACAPIVAEIRDPAIRPGYTRVLARHLGLDLEEVQSAVRGAGGRSITRGPVRAEALRGTVSTVPARTAPDADAPDAGASEAWFTDAPRYTDADAPSEFPEYVPDDAAPVPDDVYVIDAVPNISSMPEAVVVSHTVNLRDLPRDPMTRLERDALMAILQSPGALEPELLGAALDSSLMNASLEAVRASMAANVAGCADPAWFRAVAAGVPDTLRGLVAELVVAPMPQRSTDDIAVYVRDITIALVEREMKRESENLRSRLQRTDTSDRAAYREIQTLLLELEARRRTLRESA